MVRTGVRAGVTIIVASACALVFFTSTYVEFERVRVTVSGPRPPSPHHHIALDLPDLSRLRGAALVLLVDLRNYAAERRILSGSLDGASVGAITLAAGRGGRLVAIIPEHLDLERATTFVIAGDGGGWSLERAELSNARGFSSGLFNVIVAPAAARRYERPHAIAGLFVLGTFAFISLRRPWRSRLGSIGYGVLATFAGVVLLGAGVAPYLSPYRILLAFHTFVVLVAMLYLPAVERMATPIIRHVAPVVATRNLLATYALFLVLLVATSVPRIVGDGREYVAMATAFADGRWPSTDVSYHFWLYSALAAPLLALTDFFRLGPAAAFLLLNMVLLLSAFAVVTARVHAAVVLLLFAGPIVWWIDKVHAEVFMFSLLAMAVAWLDEKPWWSLLALGAAAAQNPAVAPLIPIAVLVLFAWRAPAIVDRRFWLALAGSGALALLHPLYFLARVGRAIPVLEPGKPEWPSSDHLWAVLTDANIGLFANVPTFAVAVALAAWWLRRGWRVSASQVFAIAATGVLLFGFAQTGNVNHGGTRDMSRYGLWLIPLSIPFFRVLPWTAHGSMRRAMYGVAVVSAVWCIIAFHPGRRERYVQPTPLAAFLWTRFPAISNPSPEIFVERLQGHERAWALPIATERCEKALLVARADRSAWPPQCPDRPVPDACRRPGALCYANRAGAEFVFDEVAY